MKRKSKRSNYQSRIISKQIEEINKLKDTITCLEIDRDKKKDLIKTIETIRYEFIKELEEIKSLKEKLKELIEEVLLMRNTINQIVYKGKWNLIRLLIK